MVTMLYVVIVIVYMYCEYCTVLYCRAAQVRYNGGLLLHSTFDIVQTKWMMFMDAVFVVDDED
jgi:hypothetical protein